MTTTYYLKNRNLCLCCNRTDEDLEIGYEYFGGGSKHFKADLDTLKAANIFDWLDKIISEMLKGSIIKDEYGHLVNMDYVMELAKLYYKEHQEGTEWMFEKNTKE